MSTLHFTDKGDKGAGRGRVVFLAFVLPMVIGTRGFAEAAKPAPQNAPLAIVEATFVSRSANGVSQFRFPSLPSSYASRFVFADLVLVPDKGATADPSRVSLGWNGVSTDEPELVERVTYWTGGVLKVGVGAVRWKGSAFGDFYRSVQRDGRRLELSLAGFDGNVKNVQLVFRWLNWDDFVPPFTQVTIDGEHAGHPGHGPGCQHGVGDPSRGGHWVIDGDSIRVRLSAWPGAVSYRCSLDGAAWQRCENGWSQKNLSRGWHRLAVRGWNSVGFSGVPTMRWFYVEPKVVPPAPKIVITGVDPAASLHNAPSLRVTFRREGALPASEGFCQLDDGPMAPCASPVTVNDFGEGRHVFRLRGAVEGAAATVEWTTDRTPPEPSFLSTPPELSGVDEAAFSFTANEPATFQCALDGGTLADCDPASTSVAGLDEGGHRLAVVATDRAGNVSAPIEFHWTVDTQAPEAPSLAAEPSGAIVTVRDITFSFAGEEPNLRFDCRFDGGDWVNCRSPWRQINLTEGAHVAEVRSYDILGHLSPVTEYRFQVVLTPPDLRLSRVRPTASPTRDTVASFRLDAGGSAMECRLDGAPTAECGTEINFEVAEGAHRFEARSVGPNGIVGEWQVSEWIVDRTAPSIVVDYGGVGDLSSTNAITVTFDVGDAVVVNCVLDGASSACTSPFAANRLADGPHAFLLMASDLAGNESRVEKRWVVDTEAPVVTVTNVTPSWTPTQMRTLRVDFTVDDPTAIVECQLDNGSWNRCASPWSLSGIVDGDHVASVRARDAAGNIGAAASHAWTVAAPFPLTSVNIVPISQTSVRVSWRTSIPATRQVRYGVGSFASGYTLSEATVEDTSLATIHTVTLTGLVPNTSYVLQPRSRSSTGALSVADPVEFRTPRP